MSFYPRHGRPQDYMMYEGYYGGYVGHQPSGNYYGRPPRPYFMANRGRGGFRGRGGWPGFPTKSRAPVPSLAVHGKPQPKKSSDSSGASGDTTSTPMDTSPSTATSTADSAQESSPFKKPDPVAGASPDKLPQPSKTPAAAAALSTTTAGAAGVTASVVKMEEANKEELIFPKEITDKIFSNRCELCSVVFPVVKDLYIPEVGGLEFMEACLQAKMHYQGKNHKKKLRMTMYAYMKNNRFRLCPKAKELMRDVVAIPKNTPEGGAVDLYCKLCDLSFTSVQHATQHYEGQNHARKLEGKPPVRNGYFNKLTQRWQRKQPDYEIQQEQRLYGNGSRYGRMLTTPRPILGAGGAGSSLQAALSDPNVVTVQVTPGNLISINQEPQISSAAAGVTNSQPATLSKYYCDICNVSAANHSQLETHMYGSKHAMMASKLGRPLPPPRPDSTLDAEAVASQPEGVEAIAKRSSRDYSRFRTPSGKFYCLPCNMVLNSETQFEAHFESKKHKMENMRYKPSY